MTEDERKRVYWSLLRGMAKECQNRLCATDEGHDWGPAIATDHWPDIPFVPTVAMVEMKIRRSYCQECANCGKVKRWS